MNDKNNYEVERKKLLEQLKKEAIYENEIYNKNIEELIV